MRKVILFFTQESRELEINTDAQTLGQLKSELASENLSGKKLTVKETKSTLESAESPLPAGDFTLYVYPAKSKAGHLDYSQLDPDNYDGDEKLINDIAEIKSLLKQIANKVGVELPTENTRIKDLKADADALLREMNGGNSSDDDNY